MAVTTATALLFPPTLETSPSAIRMAIGIMDVPGTNGAMIVIARATEIIKLVATMTGNMTVTAAMVGGKTIPDNF